MSERISSPFLSVQHLSISFGGIRALSRFSFEGEKGEIVGIIGPNGSGKTTFLNLLSGVYKPEEGSVTLSGKSILSLPPHKRTRIGIARTFQTPFLIPNLTAVENILLAYHSRFSLLYTFPIFFGRFPGEFQGREKAEEWVEFLDLKRYRDIPARFLPFGIQRKVELARAMMVSPTLLLLDEPLSGLNPEEKEEIMYFLYEISGRFSPLILWVEHDLPMIRSLAKRIVVLHNGEKIQEGRPEEVVDDPLVLKVYLSEE